MSDPVANWTVNVVEQDIAGASNTVVTFAFPALGIVVAVNSSVGEVIVRIPDEDDLFVNERADGDGSGRPDWGDDP